MSDVPGDFVDISEMSPEELLQRTWPSVVDELRRHHATTGVSSRDCVALVLATNDLWANAVCDPDVLRGMEPGIFVTIMRRDFVANSFRAFNVYGHFVLAEHAATVEADPPEGSIHAALLVGADVMLVTLKYQD